MITKDINGNNLPASYDDYISADSRDFGIRILANGTLLDCAIKRLSITKGSCGSQDRFSLGSVISSTLNAELMDVSSTINGAMLDVQVGLLIGEDYTYISVGKFRAIDVKSTAYTTTVTAYGHTMASTADGFNIPVGLSLLNLASAISSATGVQILFDSGIDDSKVLNGQLPENCSCYSALQVMASVVGGYVVDTYDGKIQIKRFSATPTVSVSADRMLRLPDVAEVGFLISGVQVKGTGQYNYVLTTDITINPDKTYYTRSGGGTAQDPYVYTPVEDPDPTQLPIYYERFDVVYTYGDPIVVYEDNQYMSDGLFSIYKTIVGYEYKFGDIDLSLGDPRIEGTDVLSVTDVNGNVYTIPCHQVVHTYDGGWTTQIVAVKPTAAGDGVPTTEPITQRMDNIANSAAQAQSYAETAKQSADSAKRDAETARQKAEEVNTLATQAQADASEAKQSAETAYVATNSAMYQLGIVENIVGVLDMLQKNGNYQPTEDTQAQPNKWYFERSGTDPDYVYRVVTVPTVYEKTTDTEIVEGKTYYTRSGTAPDYVYTPVQNPVIEDIDLYYEAFQNPNAQGLYELTGIKEEIQNYVSSHLVLTDSGLSLRTDKSDYRIDIAPTGIQILDGSGFPVAQYGEKAIIGSQSGFNIIIGEQDGVSQIGFYNGRTKLAYMNGSELYVTNRLSFGHFTFVERDNGHFTLKLIRSN